ncbi:MAG: hypothetical protein M0R28_20750 [Pigmentiphaga sp.]|nr:hypothetical protein [Pigmentiphaga sp.]
MRRVYLAVVIVLLAAIVVFAFQNLEMVTMRFLGLGVHAPLAVLAVVVYILGALTGGGLYGLLRQSYRKSRRMPQA